MQNPSSRSPPARQLLFAGGGLPLVVVSVSENVIKRGVSENGLERKALLDSNACARLRKGASIIVSEAPTNATDAERHSARRKKGCFK